jgi:tetratricopeptide (TPR) repeat protein
MLCKVNGETKTTVYVDEPMTISVEIIRTVGGEVNRINLPAAGLVAFVRVKVQEQGAWRDAAWRTTLLTRYGGESELELKASTPVQLELGVEPEDLRAIRGNVIMRASANLSRRENVDSNTVVVNFAGVGLSDKVADRQKRYARRARFFLQKGDRRRALEDARTLLVADPRSIEGMILMGDVLEKFGELADALASYLQAYAEIRRQFPQTIQEPGTLLIKIGGVQDRLLNP